jgi:hypothetical protein
LVAVTVRIPAKKLVDVGHDDATVAMVTRPTTEAVLQPVAREEGNSIGKSTGTEMPIAVSTMMEPICSVKTIVATTGNHMHYTVTIVHILSTVTVKDQTYVCVCAINIHTNNSVG